MFTGRSDTCSRAFGEGAFGGITRSSCGARRIFARRAEVGAFEWRTGFFVADQPQGEAIAIVLTSDCRASPDVSGLVDTRLSNQAALGIFARGALVDAIDISALVVDAGLAGLVAIAVVFARQGALFFRCIGGFVREGLVRSVFDDASVCGGLGGGFGGGFGR